MTLACSFAIPSFAQDDVDQFLNESVADAEKLMKAYLDPFMKSVSLGLNQGWYNTAKPHKIAGFDITVTINAMAIPADEMFYDVNKLNLEKLALDPTSPDYSADAANAPTIFGPERAPIFRVKDEPLTPTFEGPAGIDLEKNLKMNRVPVPIAHFAFGLPKGTELKFRYVPKLDLGDQSQFNLIGVGVLHDVKQWIPGIKTLPFDLSAFAGYTKLRLESQFDDEPNTEDAHGVFEMSAITVQGLISKKISVLTVYGGLGYNMANSSIDMLGKYDINDDGDFNDTREVDPLKLEFAASGPRMTAGFRLKLAVITLHADYTLQKYNTLTVGFGINVR